METKKDSTEEKILEAAKNVFVAKGMDGARMQEIADEAGINKALLHYYFRSKEKLFEAIFANVIEFAFPKLSLILNEETDFRSKFDHFIDAYLELLIKHPFIPGFLLKELNRDPSGLFSLIAKHAISIDPLIKHLEDAMDKGEIIRMNPLHLIVNVVSMCVFPFGVRPILKHVIFNEDKQAMDAFYHERAEVVKQFVINAIAINNEEKV